MLSLLLQNQEEWRHALDFLLTRLGAALLLGFAVAFIHQRTSEREVAVSFRVTLVLLTMLIAAVTQVIGDSVARAFSLVGALSIIRFRTVVQDTRDTVFVIFSVTLGMAVGAANFWLAGATLIAVGIAAVAAALLFKSKKRPEVTIPWILTIRFGLGRDTAEIVKSTFEHHIAHSIIQKVSTAKGGAAVEILYQILLKPTASPMGLVSALNPLEGVQSVEIVAKSTEQIG